TRVLALSVLVVTMLVAAHIPVEAQDIGLGVKGGFLHNSFDPRRALDDGNGWMAGLFIGGNRPGTVGFMSELNIQARQENDEPIYYFQIPIPALLRINIGSSRSNFRSGIAYGIAGPAVAFRLGDDPIGTIDEVESVDPSIVAGVGVELARFIIEGRGTWGQRNIAKAAGIGDLNNRTFAILAGLRFN
ncbi:MAG: hypothetical protein VYE68_06650, partial [Acidobacteriota bacterium]|nr:hypothetical protein [Acidobacteriota bacterium]